ncbi:MAG TPA: polyphosphate:AMP phosphotransferase [Terriglobia bacterium]|nr:polyphosphate:AMP phosphotransferase [Terriglobia bacterium]
MLETLDLKAKLEKEKYREAMPRLRSELSILQQAIRHAGIPVVVLFEGWDAAGKGDSIASLVYPLDPRGFKVYTTQQASKEESLRPFLWRFSVRLPSRGNFVFFDRSWYWLLLEDRAENRIDQHQAQLVAEEIREFERQLTDDGLVLIKFWLHISKKEQRRRMEDIKADRYESWRVTQQHWQRNRSYKDYSQAAEEMLVTTSTANAPWILVEATNRFYRRVRVFECTLAALHRAVSERGSSSKTSSFSSTLPGTTQPVTSPELRFQSEQVVLEGPPTILDRVDLSKRLSPEEYGTRLGPLQERLRELELECYRQRVGVVIVYEGWDAAGKGGNIKRLSQELDPRGYDVIPISAPDATEKAHHYLWRFWKQLPKAGHMAIFDRSWYGRVLVERVEGFAKEAEWRRAYQEINQFERHITYSGAVLIKFWLHLSPEEQLRRFKEREATPHKFYKITAEDWRNRTQWNVYRVAVAEMLERTSTSYAPWTIVEADDKLWARCKTLVTVTEALEARLK